MQTARHKQDRSPSHHSNLSKHVSPVKSKTIKRSVSAATIFKAKPKRHHVASKVNYSNTRVNVENVRVQRTRSRSSSRSPQKTIRAHREKRATPHPLGLDFKESTNAYRTHVYNGATTKLTTIHKSLTASLDALVGQSSPSQSQLDSARPTFAITRQIDAITENLRKELGKHRLCFKHTNEAGEEVEYEELLGDKMAEYIEHLEKEEQELKNLQGQWEQTVGEIWKLGVQALGKDCMSELLVTSSPVALSSPMKRSAEQELLDQELGSDDLPSAGVRSKKTKKSVSFVNQAQRPNFLNGPSLSKHIPPTPNLHIHDIATLEKAINELGAKEVAKLSKAEKDYQAHWAKKNAAVAMIFRE